MCLSICTASWCNSNAMTTPHLAKANLCCSPKERVLDQSATASRPVAPLAPPSPILLTSCPSWTRFKALDKSASEGGLQGHPAMACQLASWLGTTGSLDSI